MVDQSEPERVVESETIDVIKPLQPTTREWLSVTDKILLDETTGDVKFDGEIVLRLKGLNLKLFVCFVKNINVGVGFVQLKNDVWNNSDTNNSTISIQVKSWKKIARKNSGYINKKYSWRRVLFNSLRIVILQLSK